MDILFLLNISPRKKERKGIGREKRERDGGKKGGGRGERERESNLNFYIFHNCLSNKCVYYSIYNNL